MGVVTMSPPAEAQPKTANVGFVWDLTLGPMPAEIWTGFRDALQARGWAEGRNLAIRRREIERSEQGLIGEEMERLKVDVIVASPPSAFALRPAAGAAVRRTPVVFAAVSDPVAAKMAATLARPGGSMTGVSYLGLELNAKRLQLLKEAVPAATRIGVLIPAEHELKSVMRRDVAAEAQRLGVMPLFHEVPREDAANRLIAVFDELTRQRAQAVLGTQGPLFLAQRRQIAELSIKSRLPGIFELGLYTEAGCLMAYAPSLLEVYQRAAGYVDRILKGARPGDLPVEQPETLELTVNLKTAEAMGLTLPPSLLLRAARVMR